MAALNGQETTIVLTTNAQTWEVIDEISGPERTVGVIDTTTFATTGTRTGVAKDLQENGPLSFRIHHDGSDALPLGTSDTITIDWGGVGAGSKWTFAGFISKWSPRAAIDDKMVADIEITPTGAITIV